LPRPGDRGASHSSGRAIGDSLDLPGILTWPTCAS
jgi:hypothetical protein